MTKPERLFWDFVQKHILAFVCAVCLVLSVLWRVSMWDAVTQDYTYFFSYWIDQLRGEGLARTLYAPISNYPPAYNVVLWLFTLLPVDSLTVIKLMATVFDYANVVLLVLLAQTLCVVRHRATGMAAAFCFGCLLPLPVLNSSYWGQCDALYTTFLLASLLCLLRAQEPVAVLLCGVALCFKLQALFFLPVLLTVYCVRRSFSALWFLALPGAVLLSGIPTALVGGSLFAGFSVYDELKDLFGSLTLNYPNIFSLTQGASYELLKQGGILAAMLVLGAMLAWILYRRCRVKNTELVLLSVWYTLACTLFLPAMHERYAFYAELVVWVYFIAMRDWRGLWLPALLQAVTLVTYGNYFWGWQGVPGWVLALTNYAMFALLTRCLVGALHPPMHRRTGNGGEQTVPEAMPLAQQEETLWL